eukprot:1184566-Prorocentrum_minimum.AAC.4
MTAVDVGTSDGSRMRCASARGWSSSGLRTLLRRAERGGGEFGRVAWFLVRAVQLFVILVNLVQTVDRRMKIPAFVMVLVRPDMRNGG